MKLPFIIRKYQPTDLEQCRCLWQELTEWHRKIYEDPTIGGENPEDYFGKHLAKVRPERLWVAVSDFQVVGLAGLIVEGIEAEIEPVIVSESHRKKGIGTQLIKTVINEAHGLNIKFLSVKPVAGNIKAIKFFQKQGFKNLGHIELFMNFSEHHWKAGPELFECRFNF